MNDAFESSGAAVVGISPDSVAKHKKFKEANALPFVLLADPDKALIEPCGFWQKKTMYGREYMGVARSTVLVRRDGKILELWEKVKIEGHADAVLAKAKACG